MDTATAPGLRFLLGHPAHFIALGFGAGLAPAAPGTFGTLVAIPIAYALRALVPDAVFGATILAFALIATWAAQVAGRNLGAADHGSIVCDEVVAFLVVLFFIGTDGVAVAFGFLIFRLFDILKPPPIRALENAFHNGFGVMIDDLVAAGYTLVVLALWQRLFG